ncbi:hypothetical protein [Streptomyces gardneri]|uniref:hypothetical protein n=1 Tax=Streptomyces gardneri TaxID=66892 RepID=UPI0035E10D91
MGDLDDHPPPPPAIPVPVLRGDTEQRAAYRQGAVACRRVGGIGLHRGLDRLHGNPHQHRPLPRPRVLLAHVTICD